MELLSAPRVLISEVKPRCGKSFVTIGLVHELRRRGLSVSCCVVGPNLVQAAILRRLTGRWVRTIDERLLTPAQNVLSTYWAGIGSDIVVILGQGGLYDGAQPGSWRGSDAEVASLTRSPVVLVVDARGWGDGLAPLLKGFSDMARGFDMAGAIFNRAAEPGPSGDAARQRISKTLEAYSLPPELGSIPELKLSGEVPSQLTDHGENRTLLPVQFFSEAGSAVSKGVDVDALLGRASHVSSVRISDFEYKPVNRRCRIAVSDDSCFNLCFQDNLDLLRYFGAELVSFSPLADGAVPRKIGAVYLTGAYLSEYAEDLAANQSMKRSLREFTKAGGVIYSEGAASAYLCREFRCRPDRNAVEGAGVIEGAAEAVPGQTLAYREVSTVEETVLGREGLVCRGILTENWTFREDRRTPRVFRATQGNAPGLGDGLSPGAQVIATFGYNHFGSCPSMARNLVEAAEVVARI